MAQLIPYDPDRHRETLCRLLTAYLEEGATSLREVGLDEDVSGVVADDLAHNERFTPPNGQRLLILDGDVAVGCGAVRVIGPGIAEVKRMYLRPDRRGKGLGRMLIAALLDEARGLGCCEARLDTGWYMSDAHRLYRAAGFTECEAYAESEIPADFDSRWIYMSKDLTLLEP